MGRRESRTAALGGAAPLVASLLLCLAACGPSPTAGSEGGSGSGGVGASASLDKAEVYDALGKLEGEARHRALMARAEKEGVLSIYTSNTDIDKLVAAFEKDVGVKTRVYRANSESVVQRVLQEQKAGYLGNDIVDTDAGELNILSAEHVLYPYTGELRAKVRKEGKANGWTAVRFNVFVVGWNKDRVKAGEEPKSFEDLADPRWKGRISMEIGDVDWFAALYKYYLARGWTDARVRDLFTRVAANAKIAKGHTTQGELLAAGQFAVAVSSYSHTIDRAAAKGAPVAWKLANGEPVEPVVVRPNGLGLMRQAAHPAAAMLFADWMLTKGQKVLAEAYRVGAVETANDPLAKLKLVAVPEQDLLEESRKWGSLYASVLQGGQELK